MVACLFFCGAYSGWMEYFEHISHFLFCLVFFPLDLESMIIIDLIVYFICQLTNLQNSIHPIEQSVLLSLTASKWLNMPSTLTKGHGCSKQLLPAVEPTNHLNNCTIGMSCNSQPSPKGSCTESLNQEGNVSQWATYHYSTFSSKNHDFTDWILNSLPWDTWTRMV